MRISGLILLLIFQVIGLFAQKEIFLKNPSFEDKPQHAKVPKGWKDCGLENESPPDVQPVGGSFRVTRRPSDGKTYLAMIARDNDSWESVGQKLKQPLEKDKCYSFSVNLCKSDFYLSRSRITGDAINYNIPIRLLIWGGKDLCDKGELLGASPLIVNYDWITYDFTFQPKADFNYIRFEAYYQPYYLLPYCGNILIDKASAIVEGCTIDSQEYIIPPAELLELPRPKSSEELQEALLKNGPRIKFQADEGQLEMHKYKLAEASEALIQNKYLQMVAAAIQSVEGAKLIIAIRGRFLSIEKARKSAIEEALNAIGLKPDQFEIKVYNKDTSSEKWLWTPAKQDMLMRFEIKP